ncbi:TIGR02234 family membrane protein [Streptomyces sp. I05A-00742]|uniref:TIGR02234 family membrane protein n=1 Tax=Streptomyces sp. I05A-00742 TaxID=2732853 RepID=UPI0014899BA0|nr:TIGR02234 family membrane protein [Streptomyces sp. I05A-00742]
MSAAVPHPRPRTESAPAPGRSARRSVAAALFLTAAGAALVLLAGGRTWVEGTAAGAQDAALEQARGQDITGLPGALAIVGLAALVAVFAVRRAGRLLVAALLALCGAGVVVGSITGSSDTGALEDKAARTTGLSSATVEHVTHTPWPWVALAGGVLLLLAGLLALRYGRDWPAMSGRYERDGTPRPRRPRRAPDPERPEEIWKALDRGEDPTGDAASR